MGAEPWDYFVPYEENIQSALEKLRQREFEAGRYYPSEEKPVTIAEAIELADATGTQSILDIEGIADEPGYSVVSLLPVSEQLRLYGTDKPTRGMIENNMDFYDKIERGQGIYIIAYAGDKPCEIFFAGYSYD